jgi:dihydroneopterin aldolase
MTDRTQAPPRAAPDARADAAPAPAQDTGAQASAATPQAPASSATRQRIFLRDLTISAWLGVTARERARAQRIRINVEADVEPRRPLDDDYRRVVDYRHIVPNIRRIVAQEQPALLETLADRIAEATFADDSAVLAVRVRIEKLDRYSDAAGIGIEVERTRAG